MNRQEVIDFIHQTAQHLERLGEHNPAKALEIALETILPTPDSDTGLLPCGCGGVTEQTDFHDGFFPHSKVECLECGIEIMRAGNIIAEAHDEAKMAWNTAMGWKGGAE